jgi:hypothetical protein
MFLVVVVSAAVAVIAGATAYVYVRYIAMPTVQTVLARYGPGARSALHPYFAKAGVVYPPRRLALLIFKKERRMAVWAANEKQPWRFVRSFPILAASGKPGPKLREGDYQVPEGLYRIAWLNPTSSYHLSMKVDYPNAFDRNVAQREGRTRLGGDIFIHGSNVSIGCVAIGDAAIEQVFTLVADTGLGRTQLVIAPSDLRVSSPSISETTPAWIVNLYSTIAVALGEFPIALESNSVVDVRDRAKEKVFQVK